jgi:NADH-quinone oxidoreductase subunit H
VPEGADKFVYFLAPMLLMVPALCTFVVIPFGPNEQVVDLNIGVLYIVALASLGVYGIVLAGWSSNSKYALLGGLRSAAQMLSYELGVGLAIVVVVMLTKRSVDFLVVWARVGNPVFAQLARFQTAGFASLHHVPDRRFR